MKYFNKNKDELLISLVKSKSVLFDNSDAEHRNVIAKHEAWNEISKTLHIPIPEIKKRWKHLRDHYRKKERLPQTNSKNNWEYMHLLAFLSTNRDQSIIDSTTNDENKTDSCDKNEESNDSNHSGNDLKTLDPLASSDSSKSDKHIAFSQSKNIHNNTSSAVSDIEQKVRCPLHGKKVKCCRTKESIANGNQNSDVFDGQRQETVTDTLDFNGLPIKMKTSSSSSSLIHSDHAVSSDSFEISNEKEQKNISKDNIKVINRKKQKDTVKSEKTEEINNAAIPPRTIKCKNEEVSEHFDGLRNKFESIVSELEKCVDLSVRSSGVETKAQVGPVHRFFEVVADIVAKFPPHLAAETRLETCKIINELERQFYENQTGIDD